MKFRADPGFPIGVGANPSVEGGRQHTILPNFPKNCMKLKKFWSIGGRAGCSPHPPPHTLDPKLKLVENQRRRKLLTPKFMCNKSMYTIMNWLHAKSLEAKCHCQWKWLENRYILFILRKRSQWIPVKPTTKIFSFLLDRNLMPFDRKENTHVCQETQQLLPWLVILTNSRRYRNNPCKLKDNISAGRNGKQWLQQWVFLLVVSFCHSLFTLFLKEKKKRVRKTGEEKISWKETGSCFDKKGKNSD